LDIDKDPHGIYFRASWRGPEKFYPNKFGTEKISRFLFIQLLLPDSTGIIKVLGSCLCDDQIKENYYYRQEEEHGAL